MILSASMKLLRQSSDALAALLFPALLFLALLFLAFTLSAPISSARAQPAPARVFAAASLTDALNEAGDRYAQTGHPRPVFNFAGSNTLAQQIEQGADANLFFSADEDWMNYLQQRSLIAPHTRISLLTNRLVLIAPRDRPLALRIARGFALHHALNGGKLAMADPDNVPAGRYARAALQALGVWESVEGDIVRAENVRAALRFVHTGDAAAGIVYTTDAIAAGADVAVAGTFPDNTHPPISYPMAVVLGHDTSEARAFSRYLQSAGGKALFRRYGFGVR
jgi:molybdate transport system substrate-binding protein